MKDEPDMDKETELLRRFKELGIVYKDLSNTYLKSGEKSDIYVDVRKAYGDPYTRHLINKLLYEKININEGAFEITCVAACGYGGIPIASMLANESEFNLTLIRETEKEHGIGGLMDGYIPGKEDRTILVDDLFTRGTTLNHMINVLKPTGTKISGAYVIVKRGESVRTHNNKNILVNGDLAVPLNHIYTLEDLL